MRDLGALLLVLLLGALGSRAEEPPQEPRPTAFADDVLPFGTRRLGHGIAATPLGVQRDQAVAAALAWLAAHQSEDGRFEARTFARWCDGAEREAPPDLGAGSEAHDVGVTGLALAAFLHAGYTHRGAHPHAGTLRRGLRWVLAQQRVSGCFGPTDDKRFLYDHAFAAYAVVNAFGMTGSPPLRRASQAALDFSDACRNPLAWGYGIRSGSNDTSLTGAMLLPHFAAEFVNLAAQQAQRTLAFRAPLAPLSGAVGWFAEASDPSTGRVGYRSSGSPPQRYPGQGEQFRASFSECPTAVALLFAYAPSRPFKKGGMVSQRIEVVAETPPRWLPKSGGVDLMYWWFGSMAMARVDGTHAERWLRSATKALVESQRSDGDFCDARGSWDPVGVWGVDGGRVYATAVGALTLTAHAAFPWGNTEELALAKLVGDGGAEAERRKRGLRAAVAQPTRQSTNGALLAVRDPRADIRRAAVVALGRIGPVARSKQTRQALSSAAAADVDGRVRRAAVWALGRVGEDKRAWASILSRLEAQDDPAWGFLREVSLARARGKPHPALAGSLRWARDPDLLLEAARRRGLLESDTLDAVEAHDAERLARYLQLPPIATLPASGEALSAFEPAFGTLNLRDSGLHAMLEAIAGGGVRFDALREAAGEALHAISGAKALPKAPESQAGRVLHRALVRLVVARHARALMLRDEEARMRAGASQQELWESGRALASRARTDLASIRVGWDGAAGRPHQVTAALLWLEADYIHAWFGFSIQGEAAGLNRSFEALDEALWAWDGTRTARYLALRKAELLLDFARETEEDDARASLYEGVLVLYADAATGDPRDLPDRKLTVAAFAARAEVCLEARRVGRINFLRRGRAHEAELRRRMPDLGSDPRDEAAIVSAARLLNKGGDQNRALALLVRCSARAARAGHGELSARLARLRKRMLQGG